MRGAGGRRGWWTVTVGLAFAVWSAQAADVELRMAGAPTRGFGDVESALEAAAALRQSGWPSGGVTLQLPPGLLRLTKPLAIGARHGGVQGAPLSIVGAPGGRTVLSAARPIDAWREPDADLRDRLPPAAQAHVRQAHVAGARFWQPGTRHGQGWPHSPAPMDLLHGGQAMPVAAWPDEGFATIGEVLDEGQAVAVRGAPPVGAPVAAGGWLHGYWGRDWADEWIGLQSANDASGRLRLEGAPPRHGAVAGQRLRLVQLPALLDRPGEWYLDEAGSRLLFWPPDETPGTDAVTDGLHVLRVDGASHVRLVELTLEGSRSDALVVTGGRDVRAERLHIRNVGGRAAWLSGVAHAIVDSDIHDTGQGGIALWGGDRQTLQAAGLLAEGNRLRRLNRWLRTYRPAIEVGGVGQIVRGNLIAELPHAAVLFGGNDHLFEFNVVHDVAQETGDVGAFYIGRDWTARGHVIRHNHLHDIRGPGRWGSRGIYLDDQASGVTVIGNLFVGVDQAVFIGGGRDNLVDNNFFVASAPPLLADRRGRTWQRALTEAPDGVLQQALRTLASEGSAHARRYPLLRDLLQRQPGEPIGNVVRRHAVADDARDRIDEGVRLDVDRRFGRDDVRFATPGPLDRRRSARDFALDPTAPLVREGFAPLALDAMACTAERWSGVDGAARRHGCRWNAGTP